MKRFRLDTDWFSSRVIVTAVMIAVHGLAIYGFAQVNGNAIASTPLKPIEVTLITESKQLENWEPPVVQAAMVSPPITSAIPDISLAVITPAAALSNAITVVPPSEREIAENLPGAPHEMSVVEYVREPSPRYPSASRRQRAEGAVLLRVLVDESGHARDIQVYRSSGHQPLDEAAREAVARALFKPYVENGVTRAAFVMIPIEFSLNRHS
jgi:protein TonB